MARRKKRKKSFSIITFLLLSLIIGLIYLYVSERRKIDYSLQSQEINEVIDKALINLGITDVDILEIYREEKEEKNKKWVQVTKEIKIPYDGNFLSYQNKISLEVKKVKAEVLGVKIDEAENIFTIKIGIKDLIMQILILKKISARKIALIIDDAGYDRNNLSKFLDIGIPLTVAILPGETYSKQIASEAINQGCQIILHLPLEPYGYPEINPGSHAALTGMTNKQIRNLVKDNINSVPGICGVNNHMGSKFTANQKKMEEVIKVIGEHNLFYIDSKTSSDSVGYSTARRLGVKTAEREIFIDNKNNIDYVKTQLRKLASLAIKNGQAIGIGHFQKEMTPLAIKEIISEFKKQNIEFVFVSELVK